MSKCPVYRGMNMSNKIYFNPNVSPSIRKSKPPRTKSQTFCYTDQLGEALKKLETSQEETKNELNELKGLTEQIVVQLKEFKRKVMKRLSKLGLNQKQAKEEQNKTDQQLQELKTELDRLHALINQQHEKHQARLKNLLETINEYIEALQQKETETVSTVLESSDLQRVVLEDISKRQEAIEQKLQDELAQLKALLSNLAEQSSENYDIQLEYQKLHEKMLHKIVELQVASKGE